MNLQSRVAAEFTQRFGSPPSAIVRAPGRVNLIGEHTDYNDGFVLPMAIERYTIMAADRHPGGNVTVHSETTGETATFGVRTPVIPGEPAWSNYVRGVVAGFQRRGVKV